MYDPLTSPHPGIDREMPPSYWAASAGVPPPDDGPVPGDKDVDVAIIGGGYTGLSCAYALSREHGIRAAVLEANRPGWGCSGRNGGFVRPSIGKLGYRSVIDKWGLDVARRVYREAEAAVGTLRALVADGRIECDMQQGYFKIAHRPDHMRGLEAEARLLETSFGYRPELLDADSVRRDHVGLAECFGALHHPAYFGLHPLKLALGVLRLARTAGATVHSGATVTDWTKRDGWHALRTPTGIVRAKTVAIATNGYTPERLHRCLAGTVLPVLSHIIVTQPLSAGERAACNFRTLGMLVDTRRINHYYRLLPDNRVLMGSRGAPSDDACASAVQRDYLLAALKKKFPPLAGVTVDYDWNGWVCLTYDWVPHIHRAKDDPSVHYAIGYGGGGVAFALHAGRLLAANIAGRPLGVDIPSTTTPLPRYPLPALRRIAQKAALAWLEFTDRRD